MPGVDEEHTVAALSHSRAQWAEPPEKAYCREQIAHGPDEFCYVQGAGIAAHADASEQVWIISSLKQQESPRDKQGRGVGHEPSMHALQGDVTQAIT